MSGLAGRNAGSRRRVRAIKHDDVKASPAIRAQCAPWGDAGLCQWRALAANAISPLAAALTFGRALGAPEGGDVVHMHLGHLFAPKEGRQLVGGSVTAGLSAGFEMATAAAEHHHGSGVHATSRGQMAGSGAVSAGFRAPPLQMLMPRANPLFARLSAPQGLQKP